MYEMYTFRNVFTAMWGKCRSMLGSCDFVPDAPDRFIMPKTDFPSPLLSEYYSYVIKYYRLFLFLMGMIIKLHS